jgi:hypothetical protein
MKLREVDNLLLNMSGGLMPEHLSAREKKLLAKEFGKDWLLVLGYQTNLEYLEEKANAPHKE